MTRAILLAGAFFLGLAIGRRRPRGVQVWTGSPEDWAIMRANLWRDLERVDSV